jgi:thiol-disulfide isomerase/thioredoxin
MNYSHRFLVLAAAWVLVSGCDKKSEINASESSSKKSDSATSTASSVPAKSGKESAKPDDSKEKVVASPAEEDAKNLRTLDFPALKELVSKSKAKLTMIPVWATWCVPCIKEMPHMAEFYEKQHKNGLEIIALCVGDKSDDDEAEAMADKIADLKSPFHHYILPEDGSEAFFKSFGERYGGTLPATIVLDQKGEVALFTRNGWTDKSLAEIIVPKLK